MIEERTEKVLASVAVAIICAGAAAVAIYFSFSWANLIVLWCSLYLSLAIASWVVAFSPASRRTKWWAIIMLLGYADFSVLWFLLGQKWLLPNTVFFAAVVPQLIFLFLLTWSYWKIASLSVIFLIPSIVWSVFLAQMVLALPPKYNRIHVVKVVMALQEAPDVFLGFWYPGRNTNVTGYSAPIAPDPTASIGSGTKPPWSAVSYQAINSTGSVLFNLPFRSQTKGYIENHFSRDLETVPPELQTKLENELAPNIKKGDKLMVGVGGDRWVVGTVNGFKAVSPACGGLVLGVLTIDGESDRELAAGTAGTEFLIKPGSRLPDPQTISSGTPMGIFPGLELTASEDGALKTALNEYIAHQYRDFKDLTPDEVAGDKRMAEEVKLANLDVQLIYTHVHVNLGREHEGFLISAGWGDGRECYTSLSAFVEKRGDSYGIIPIRSARGEPDRTGEDERLEFKDCAAMDGVVNVVDYNEDGLGDLIIETYGYESSGYTLLEFDGEKFIDTEIGYAWGC